MIIIRHDPQDSPQMTSEKLAQSVLKDDRRMKWEFPYVLARHLKRFRGKAEDYEEEVCWFANAVGIDQVDFYIQFVYEFDHKVEFADNGRNNFLEAAKLAKEFPIPFPPHVQAKPPTDWHVFVYSVCVYLAEYTDPKPFALSQPELSGVTGRGKNAINRIVKWLMNNGLIERVDATYSFGNGKPRAMKYVVPEPAQIFNTLRGRELSNSVMEAKEVNEVNTVKGGTLLTAKEMAEHLSCSVATIHKLRKGEQIPSVKIGKMYRYPLED